MKRKTINFILSSLAGTITVLALTIAIYATFFHDLLGQFLELSQETITLISRDPVNVGVMLFANVAHGFLISAVVMWGKFYRPVKAGLAASCVAFLTELYFCFSQYAIMKTMSIQSAVIDTLMWTFVNFAVGAVVSLILRRDRPDKTEYQVVWLALLLSPND
ncbi:MAG: hypothetical protein IJ740_15155 [Ruminococcus sp.]|nr:hypothetical protein [Ruminococcus sp.]